MTKMKNKSPNFSKGGESSLRLVSWKTWLHIFSIPSKFPLGGNKFPLLGRERRRAGKLWLSLPLPEPCCFPYSRLLQPTALLNSGHTRTGVRPPALRHASWEGRKCMWQNEETPMIVDGRFGTPAPDSSRLWRKLSKVTARLCVSPFSLAQPSEPCLSSLPYYLVSKLGF